MSENLPTGDTKTRFDELANGYQPKSPPKQAQLLPFKTQIQELRKREAAYDDIRLLLEDVGVSVSLNTVYRFCRDVIGEKSNRPRKARSPKHPTSINSPVQPPPVGIQTALRENRERFTGPWMRRKRGPRIADSKNL